MYRLDDDQHWIYPHPHPHHPHLGPNFVVSPIGRGPKGPKGDPLKYSDMTEEEKNDLASRVGKVDIIANYQVFSDTLDLDEAKNTINPGFGAPLAGSIYTMEVNGLTVPADEFTVDTTTGVLSFNQIVGGALNDKIVVRRIDFVTEQPEDPAEELYS